MKECFTTAKESLNILALRIEDEIRNMDKSVNNVYLGHLTIEDPTLSCFSNDKCHIKCIEHWSINENCTDKEDVCKSNISHITCKCKATSIFGISSVIVGSWAMTLFYKLIKEWQRDGKVTFSNIFIMDAHMLLDFSWQNLNTGNWTDIPKDWRLIYTWTTILLAVFLLQELLSKDEHDNECIFLQQKFDELVKICDRGLIMGCPIVDNPLHKVASILNKFVKNDLNSIAGLNDFSFESDAYKFNLITFPLDCLKSPSLNDFLLKHMESNKPVKLLNIIDHWPALSKWNINYLSGLAGGRTVPVELGSRYTDDDWCQQLMTFNEYLKDFVLKTNCETQGYLAQHQLLDQIPELLDDIMVPDYCHMGDEEPRINAWIGPKGTISPLHYDPDHNILVQVAGGKYIRLYEESETKHLYPFEDNLLKNTSQLDVENPDYVCFPLSANAKYVDLILNSGESLYIPPKCWHYVRSLSPSISISFWWK